MIDIRDKLNDQDFTALIDAITVAAARIDRKHHTAVCATTYAILRELGLSDNEITETQLDIQKRISLGIFKP